jgi:hypothetical protein
MDGHATKQTRRVRCEGSLEAPDRAAQQQGCIVAFGKPKCAARVSKCMRTLSSNRVYLLESWQDKVHSVQFVQFPPHAAKVYVGTSTRVCPISPVIHLPMPSAYCVLGQ